MYDFVAYGMLAASLVGKPDAASALVMFTLLPLLFLGRGFPSDMLPSSMLNSLVGSLLANGSLSAGAWMSIVGHKVYVIGVDGTGSARPASDGCEPVWLP